MFRLFSALFCCASRKLKAIAFWHGRKCAIDVIDLTSKRWRRIVNSAEWLFGQFILFFFFLSSSLRRLCSSSPLPITLHSEARCRFAEDFVHWKAVYKRHTCSRTSIGLSFTYARWLNIMAKLMVLMGSWHAICNQYARALVFVFVFVVNVKA